MKKITILLGLALFTSSAFAGPASIRGSQNDVIKTLLSQYDSCTVSPVGAELGSDAYASGRYVLTVICKADSERQELVTLNYLEEEHFDIEGGTAQWKKVD